MKSFLHLKAPEEARNEYFSIFDSFRLSKEKIKSDFGLDRILAKDLFAPESLPAFNRSTVDGYAVRSKDTFGASESLPAFFKVIGEVNMGKPTPLEINSGEAAIIHTGGMLPKNADAVVMIENTQTTLIGEIEVGRAVGHFENMILAGEDVQSGSLIFERGWKLRPGDIGALMSVGMIEIEVYRPLNIAIISSGDEVVDPHFEIHQGQVRDVNSYTLSALVQKYGGHSHLYGISPDNRTIFSKIARQAFQENDMVIITAGSSASVRDLTAEVIQGLGEPGVLVHGVNVRPGKPTILAVCDGKPVIGLPGNPVSAYVIANLFVAPLIRKLSGQTNFFWEQKINGILTVNLASSSGREDWVPVNIIRDEHSKNCLIEPIFYKSNLIFSIIKAEGFIRIPPDITGYSANSEVEVVIF